MCDLIPIYSALWTEELKLVVISAFKEHSSKKHLDCNSTKSKNISYILKYTQKS